MSELIRRSHGISVRAQDEAARSIDVIASSDAIDSYGEILVQDWDLERYKKNPVVLYGHNSWGKPIGYASEVRVQDGQLLAKLHFVDARANPEAEQVWQGILQGSLRAVSVGFRSREASMRRIGEHDVYVLSGNELLEISVVPIPANPEAVALAKKSFDIIRALVGASTQSDQEPEMNVKTILALLSLNDTATEAEVVDKVKALEKRVADADARVESAVSREKAATAQVSELLAEAGVDNVEKAKGAIAAGKAAVAELADAKVKNEALERTQLIADAKAAKKLTPAQEEGLKGKSIDFVKSFIELQHPNPTLAKTEEEQPQVNSSALTFEGKSWNDLSPSEKHNLFHTNKDLYVAMRDAA